MFLAEILKEELVRYKYRILIATIGIFVILAGVVFFYNTIPKQITGTLYVSMAKEGELVHVFEYNFLDAGQGFQQAIAFDGVTSMQIETIKNRVGESFSVFASSVPSESTRGVSNILYLNTADDSSSFVLPSDNVLYKERNLNYSKTFKLLAFSAQEKINTNTDLGAPDSVEDWGIYVVNPATQEMGKVGIGIDPIWSPDGTSVVFLGKSGIQQYSFPSAETFNAETPFEKESSIGTNMNMDISPDGAQMVLTSPNDRGLYTMQIDSWTPFKSSSLQNIAAKDTVYFWPTYSPDGQFMAVQAIDVVADEVLQGQRIEIFDMTSSKKIREISLEGFDFTRSFIDDWAY